MCALCLHGEFPIAVFSCLYGSKRRLQYRALLCVVLQGGGLAGRGGGE